jgi:hypothetical protein
MVNVRMTTWLMVMVSVVFGFGLPEAQATVVFNDGGTHTVDWAIYDYVWVRNSTLSQPTTLNLVTGGFISQCLDIYDSSRANVSGGSIHHSLDAYDSSQVNISGGSFGGSLIADFSSQVRISGVSIGGGLYALNSSQITIYGSGFNYPYGTLTGRGLLTGTLASGEIINNAFYVYGNARIVLVPEPATLSLFALASLAILRKHRK